jgi:alginate O-acetyltransferase complex protein AlgI
MLFNSLRFLFLFLPIVYFIFWRLTGSTRRYAWLTIASYVFYANWNYKFCLLMAFSTVVSYTAGLGFLKFADPARRRLCLVTPIVLDLLLLGFFKYFNFIALSFGSLLRWVNHPAIIHPLDIVLPIGISFYTFHTITYVVDSYRGVITPTTDPWEFACYVSFFPQLVAGPIVRFRQIRWDLDHLAEGEQVRDLNRAWSFFAIGLMKKVLIADSLAAIIDPALRHYSQLSTAATWLCALGFTYQLYFDFSGYSDMAVGLGQMFGLRLPQNFNSPYKAIDPADFWHRWHISLSTCLRDYLYIPLGGSRDGRGKTYRNILVTMLLGGLWHGANWTFVVWGAYHGVLLILTRALGQQLNHVAVIVRRAMTFVAVVIGWVLFRATDLTMAATLLRRMFAFQSGLTLPATAGLTLMLAVAALIAHLGRNSFEMKHEWSVGTSAAMAVGYVTCLVIIAGGVVSPFLYFQF